MSLGDKHPEVKSSASGPLQEMREFWEAVRVPNFEEDESESARALRTRLQELEAAAEARGGSKRKRLDTAPVNEFQEVGALMLAYYKEKLDQSFNNDVVRKAVPKIGQLFNVAFVVVVLRLVLPRLLAIESMNDLEENLGFFGIPSRAELAEYASQVTSLPLPVKLAGFVGIFVVEKLFCLTEFLPVGIVLPTLSPVLFGGVAQGVAVSMFSSTAGATANFVLSKQFLGEKIKGFSAFGGTPVGDTAWYNAVDRNFEREGFKTALMLRLAPILPIPVDAHWYLCGATSLTLGEFVLAQLVGSFKASFIDAYFGSLLMAEFISGQDLGLPSQTKWVVCVEVVAIILTSVLVTNAATTTLDNLLQEEGWDRSTAMGNFTTGIGSKLAGTDPVGEEYDPRQ